MKRVCVFFSIVIGMTGCSSGENLSLGERPLSLEQQSAASRTERLTTPEVYAEPASKEAAVGEKDGDGEPSIRTARESCVSTCPPVRFEVQDPTRISHYSAEELGVVSLCGAPAQARECLDKAIREGGQVLARSEGRLVLFFPVRLESFLDAARARIDSDALEGRWSESLHRVIPGIHGRKLDTEGTARRFLESVRRGDTSFALQIDEIPSRSADPAAYARFEPAVLIGSYETTFSPSRNRTTNVKLAASKLDGLFLMPGAEFSYNAWVGERSEARGFKEAPVIEQGQLVEGLGGGACQVSSTVHAAALLTGLDIVERYNHSLPSSYIARGMDAVVSYPVLDLRVRNTLEHPIVLRVRTENNTLTAQFYSDAPRESRVLFRQEVAAEIPFKEIISVDPALDPGTIRITKRGKVGYRVLRSRITLRHGEETYEKFLDDTYQPQTQYVSVAPDAIYPVPPEDAVEDEDNV